MVFMKSGMRYTIILFVILLNCALKSIADDDSRVSGDAASQGVDNKQDTAKEHDTKSEDSEKISTNIEDKHENAKLEISDPPVSANDNNKDQNEQPDGNAESQAGESKHQNEKAEEVEQPADNQDEKDEGSKSENSPSNVDTKKSITKEEEDNNHKNSLSDVNAYTSYESPASAIKRETRDYTDFLGLPRDASYFFDDHEPFINNNSDNRVGRAVPSKESKGQKSKFKSKDASEDDIDEDDEDIDKEEEEEKVSEDDYDDDDDIDSDCQPTPACTSSTACPTTRPTCTTSPKCTTTPKTTAFKCTTEFKCRTTTEKTKCPRICAKVNKKIIGESLTTDPVVGWDTNKKRVNPKKRRYHSKINSSK